MTELRLKLKIEGYSPISINQDAFDVANAGVTITRVGKELTIVIKFDEGPSCLCGSIISCDVPFEVTELYLPESINQITTPLGWLNIKKSDLFSINKKLLSSDGNLIIYKNKVLRQIGEEESIIIPEGITVIGESAFEGKKNLTKITFPASIIEIERCAFRYCWDLPLKFPRNLEVIGDYAFERCGRTKTSKINIPAKVQKIGNYAFKSCSEVISVKIGKSVTDIGQGAFAACDRIATFEGKGTEKYGGRFLVWDKRLVSVAVDSSILDNNEWHLPEDIEEIGDWAITYEDSDRHWTTVRKLPSNLKRIGEKALYGVRGGEPVVIPESVEEIGEGAFSPRMKVTGKYVSKEGVVIKDNKVLFKNFTHIKPEGYTSVAASDPEYNVPIGVIRIGDFANLRVDKITLPEGLESIGENAVYISEEVKIPSTLKTCDNLYCRDNFELTFPDGMISMGLTFNTANVNEIRLMGNPPIFFGNSYGSAIIVVPEEKFLEYKEAYTGILDERNFPNGRIAFRNPNGDLRYVPENEVKETENEEAKFWQNFEILAQSNEPFSNLLDKYPHGVKKGEGESFYFIDILPDYLRIELRYVKRNSKACCTLHLLQNETSIYEALSAYKLKTAIGIETDLLFLSVEKPMNRGQQWNVPLDMDNLGVYGTLYTAAVIQADQVAPKIQKFLEETDKK